MERWNKPGWRPIGFWLCFKDKKAVRAAEKVCRTETEVVLMVGLADDEERQRIADEGLLAKDREDMVKVRQKYPDLFPGEFVADWL
jgi:hypothetical protein